MAGKSGRVPTTKRPLLRHPRWAGQRISGRLLLHIEDGYGDAFMMPGGSRRCVNVSAPCSFESNPA
jgi:hypothetical protein